MVLEILVSDDYLHSTNNVFDTHRCSSPTCSCSAFRINLSKWNGLKVNTESSCYICSDTKCVIFFVGLYLLSY